MNTRDTPSNLGLIPLGDIPLTEACSVLEARRKIRSVAELVSGDELLATRLATVCSETARRLQRMNSNGRIGVGLKARSGNRELLLEFVGDLDDASIGFLHRFFDRVEIARSGDGLSIRRGAVLLRAATADQISLPKLQAIVQQKTRDQLLEEIQSKNVELQESLESLKRTRSAKDRMESELNIGREIQMSMLPLSFPAFVEQQEFDVHAALYPAQEVGGDFYDMFMVDLDHFCFCVGDVSGKGVPAALFMAVTKTLIKSRAANDLSPASILSHVNSEQAEGNDSAMFVTIFLGMLNLQTGELAYSNAGHNPPMLLRRDGSALRIDRRHGPVVGAMEGFAYGEDSVTLAPGELLYLYTDGVTEAMDSGRKLYSEQRLTALLDGSRFESAKQAVTETVDDVWRFQGDASQADDITVMAVLYHGPMTVEGESELTLAMKNDVAEIDTINRTFNDFARQHRLAEKDQRRVNICLDELLSNIIHHGYGDEDEHLIEIHIRLLDGELAVTIVDDGKPFNPFQNAPPDTGLSVDERPIGGLGVHLVRSFMDTVSYERHGENNVVTLHKHLDIDNES